MTPEDENGIRALHVECECDGGHLTGLCDMCAEDWPCDTFKVLQALDEERAAHQRTKRKTAYQDLSDACEDYRQACVRAQDSSDAAKRWAKRWKFCAKVLRGLVQDWHALVQVNKAAEAKVKKLREALIEADRFGFGYPDVRAKVRQALKETE